MKGLSASEFEAFAEWAGTIDAHYSVITQIAINGNRLLQVYRLGNVKKLFEIWEDELEIKDLHRTSYISHFRSTRKPIEDLAERV